MKLKYSEQAQILIDSMHEFPFNEFEKWFFENLTVGSQNVMMFLLETKNNKTIETKK